MKRITQTDVIKSNDVNGNIISENKLEYSVERDISEFSGNELPPLSVVQQLVDQTIPPTEVPRILPWTSSEIVAQDYYRSHPINGIEYLFRSLVDDNTSEPTLITAEGDAWTNLGATSDGFSPSLWDIGTTYSIGDFARISASSGNVFKSKTNSNIGNEPVSETTDANWECLGNYTGLFPNDAPYQLDDVTFDTATQSVYKSNVDNNDYPLDGQITGSWQVVGVVISDEEVSLTKTWSSQKISDAIASTSGASSKGSFPSTDTGQSVINIPHGLTGIPAWFSVQGTNVISTGVINKSDLTIDATNIIITPEFMNNDGSTLNFLWKAEL